MKIGYRIARNTSLSIRLIAVKRKNGIETRAEVEANGSPWLRANKNAAQIKINDRTIVGVFPNTTGKVLSPDSASPFISGRVVSKATDEKQSKYGSIYLNKDIFRVTNPFPR